MAGRGRCRDGQLMKCHSRNPQFERLRGAFTVLELLIVLGIIVAIASMAMPQLISSIRESSVFDAADRIRETAAEARRFAIDTGVDYEFRYEVGGAAVVVLPAENEQAAYDEQDTNNTTEKWMRLLEELPEGFTLRAPEGVTEAGETLDAIRFGDLQGESLTRKSWSTPVIFRFDGTAEDFELRVVNEDGLTSVVSIRGLTGSIKTSQVFQESD